MCPGNKIGQMSYIRKLLYCVCSYLDQSERAGTYYPSYYKLSPALSSVNARVANRGRRRRKPLLGLPLGRSRCNHPNTRTSMGVTAARATATNTGSRKDDV